MDNIANGIMDFFQGGAAEVMRRLPEIDGKVGLGFDLATMVTIIGATILFFREKARLAIKRDKFKIQQDAAGAAAEVLVSFINRLSKIHSHEISENIHSVRKSSHALCASGRINYDVAKNARDQIDTVKHGGMAILDEAVGMRYALRPIMGAMGDENYFKTYWLHLEKLLALQNRIASGVALFSELLKFHGHFEKLAARKDPLEEEEWAKLSAEFFGSLIHQDSDFLRRSVLREVLWVLENLDPGTDRNVDLYLRALNRTDEAHYTSQEMEAVLKDFAAFCSLAVQGGGRVNVNGHLSEPLPTAVLREITHTMLELTTEVQVLLSDTSCARGLLLASDEEISASFTHEREKYRNELKAGILTG